MIIKQCLNCLLQVLNGVNIILPVHSQEGRENFQIGKPKVIEFKIWYRALTSDKGATATSSGRNVSFRENNLHHHQVCHECGFQVQPQVSTTNLHITITIVWTPNC